MEAENRRYYSPLVIDRDKLSGQVIAVDKLSGQVIKYIAWTSYPGKLSRSITKAE